MPVRGMSRAAALARFHEFTGNYITAAECRIKFPGWLEQRELQGLAHVYDHESDMYRSKFQDTPHLVALKPDPELTGRMIPDFDRVVVREAPNVHINCYDVDEDGTWWYGVVIQIRQFPEGPLPALVGEIPKGFNLDRVLGDQPEASSDASVREAIEELGRSLKEAPVHLLRMRKSNTVTALSVSDIYEAHVDRLSVTDAATDPDEHIVFSEMIPLSEMGRRMREVTDSDGICWYVGADGATILPFLLRHQEAARQFHGLA